jgi:hypothetical protein
MTPRAEQPVPDRVRIGDRERAEAADRLAAHAAAGRLTLDELEQRLEQVHAAVHARDLAAVEADLPVPARAPRPMRRPAPHVPVALLVLLVAVLASVAVGHPIAPPFIAALLVWRAARRSTGVALPWQRAA